MNYIIVDATPSLACREMDAAGEKFREDAHFGGSVIPPIRLNHACKGTADCKDDFYCTCVDDCDDCGPPAVCPEGAPANGTACTEVPNATIAQCCSKCTCSSDNYGECKTLRKDAVIEPGDVYGYTLTSHSCKNDCECENYNCWQGDLKFEGKKYTNICQDKYYYGYENCSFHTSGTFKDYGYVECDGNIV